MDEKSNSAKNYAIHALPKTLGSAAVAYLICFGIGMYAIIAKMWILLFIISFITIFTMFAFLVYLLIIVLFNAQQSGIAVMRINIPTNDIDIKNPE